MSNEWTAPEPLEACQQDVVVFKRVYIHPSSNQKLKSTLQMDYVHVEMCKLNGCG